MLHYVKYLWLWLELDRYYTKMFDMCDVPMPYRDIIFCQKCCYKNYLKIKAIKRLIARYERKYGYSYTPDKDEWEYWL